MGQMQQEGRDMIVAMTVDVTRRRNRDDGRMSNIGKGDTAVVVAGKM